jgi:hypothetical protein
LILGGIGLALYGRRNSRNSPNAPKYRGTRLFLVTAVADRILRTPLLHTDSLHIVDRMGRDMDLLVREFVHRTACLDAFDAAEKKQYVNSKRCPKMVKEACIPLNVALSRFQKIISMSRPGSRSNRLGTDVYSRCSDEAPRGRHELQRHGRRASPWAEGRPL